MKMVSSRLVSAFVCLCYLLLALFIPSAAKVTLARGPLTSKRIAFLGVTVWVRTVCQGLPLSFVADVYATVLQIS